MIKIAGCNTMFLFSDEKEKDDSGSFYITELSEENCNKREQVNVDIQN